MDFRKLFRELKRRKVYHVAISYAITAWLIAQVLDLGTDAFEAPPWVMKMALILLLVGFPIVLVLAWAYELSPEGVVRTDFVRGKANPNPQARKRPMVQLAIFGLLIAAAGFLFFYKSDLWGSTQPEGDPLQAPNSITIAMLPLINLSEDKELTYFSSQLTNEIINELAKVRSFAVTAFSTIYSFQENGRSTQEIADTYGVNYLMRGSARAFSQGDSIKIDIELIEPKTGRRLWGEAYEELMGKAPALQAAIAKKVAANLNVQLSPSEAASLSGNKTNNGQAYLKFLKARQEFYFYTDSSINRARLLLEEALELDPDYTEVHTLLAWILTSYAWPAFKKDEETLIWSKEKTAYHLDKAMSQNPNSSDIYLVKANYVMSYKDDLKAANEYVNKALEINSWPELPTNHCVCTAVTVNIVRGNIARAKEISYLARIIEPGSIMILNDAFYIDLIERNFKAASQKMEQALSLMNVPVIRFQLGWGYLNEGRYREAIQMLHSAYPEITNQTPAGIAYLSNAHYQLEELAESNRYKDHLESLLAEGETNVMVDLALIAAARGNPNQMFDYLERYMDESPIGMSFQLNTDPVFDPYEEDPRFHALRERMGYYE
ncbi:hypothetical protein [Robiginitalea sp. IMCC43444]|uniref:hypothetical protein n=1 Tax=Robiginitalea sp. IMCC43444 TaxID=3459121 RepID=UPI00404329D7